MLLAIYALCPSVVLPPPRHQPFPSSHLSRRAVLSFAASPAVLAISAPVVATEISEYTIADSGLQYAELRTGSGAAPQAGQRVVIDYIMSRRAGAKIYNTVESHEPLSWTLGDGSVIKGLEQAVVGGGGVPPMLPGSARRVIVPQSLGYGIKESTWTTIVRKIGPVPPEFVWLDAKSEKVNSYLRFKNIYLNENRIDQPDLVFIIKLNSVEPKVSTDVPTDLPTDAPAPAIE